MDSIKERARNWVARNCFIGEPIDNFQAAIACEEMAEEQKRMDKKKALKAFCKCCFATPFERKHCQKVGGCGRYKNFKSLI